jgi:hypothetical protein
VEIDIYVGGWMDAKCMRMGNHGRMEDPVAHGLILRCGCSILLADWCQRYLPKTKRRKMMKGWDSDDQLPG